MMRLLINTTSSKQGFPRPLEYICRARVSLEVAGDQFSPLGIEYDATALATSCILVEDGHLDVSSFADGATPESDLVLQPVVFYLEIVCSPPMACHRETRRLGCREYQTHLAFL